MPGGAHGPITTTSSIGGETRSTAARTRWSRVEPSTSARVLSVPKRDDRPPAKITAARRGPAAPEAGSWTGIAASSRIRTLGRDMKADSDTASPGQERPADYDIGAFSATPPWIV